MCMVSCLHGSRTVHVSGAYSQSIKFCGTQVMVVVRYHVYLGTEHRFSEIATGTFSLSVISLVPLFFFKGDLRGSKCWPVSQDSDRDGC